MKTGVVVFPGSNCDADCHHVIGTVLENEVEYIWHEDTIDESFDFVILPGGFSYGDYLRPGAIANHSKVMPSLKEFAGSGKPVLGICNGFQILLESGLLPGALMTNESTRFISRFVELSVVNTDTMFTRQYNDSTLSMPVAHNEGNYYIDGDGYKDLVDNNQIVFKYTSNVNGSVGGIAGIINKEGNVLGMMPHPERCSEGILCSTSGLPLFQSVLK